MEKMNAIRLAQKILNLDQDNQSLTQQFKSIIENGLTPLDVNSAHIKNILVLGAGISGLLCAFLLKRSGYNVKVLEANPKRIGGRIKTFKSTNESKPVFQDPLQYAEAGAMRFPTAHPLVKQLIDSLDLSHLVRPFYNVDVSKTQSKAPTFETWIYANKTLIRRKTYQEQAQLSNESNCHLNFPIPQKYQKKTARQLIVDALKPLNLKIDASLPMDKRVEGYAQIIEEYGYLNAHQFFKNVAKFPEEVIAFIGTVENITSRLYLSFIQVFIELNYINEQAQFYELKGGSWQLPYALYNHIKDDVYLNHRVTHINWTQNSVTVKTQTPSLKEKPTSIDELKEFEADTLICTLPFPCLRMVHINPNFSYPKHRAIMELHYDSATKVLLEFSKRFWEFDETTWKKELNGPYRGHNSHGGGTVTDLPNRFIYFPSHPIENSLGGVVLASYTWSDDATKWDALPSFERYQVALEGLKEIYGDDIEKFYTGVGKTQSWSQSPFSFGESAIFSPGQLIDLHEHIQTSQGPIHFAGDHASLKHAWVEGAIESAIRCVIEIHQKNIDTVNKQFECSHQIKKKSA